MPSRPFARDPAVGAGTGAEVSSSDSGHRFGELAPIDSRQYGPPTAAVGANGRPPLQLKGIDDYLKFAYPGGTVYRTSNKEPENAFAGGWTRPPGYDDLCKHVDTDQGKGSNWVSTSHDFGAACNLIPNWAGGNYGKYLYEVSLKGNEGIYVNPTYQAIKKHRNPFAEQQEVAVYKTIAGARVEAVWVERDEPLEPAPDNPWADQFRLVFANSYQRFSEHEFESMVNVD